MRKIIPEGGLIPKGYGVAWRAYNGNFEIICYPLGINLIVRLYFHCYYAILKGLFNSKYESELLQATARGMWAVQNKEKE